MQTELWAYCALSSVVLLALTSDICGQTSSKDLCLVSLWRLTFPLLITNATVSRHMRRFSTICWKNEHIMVAHSFLKGLFAVSSFLLFEQAMFSSIYIPTCLFWYTTDSTGSFEWPYRWTIAVLTGLAAPAVWSYDRLIDLSEIGHGAGLINHCRLPFGDACRRDTHKSSTSSSLKQRCKI